MEYSEFEKKAKEIGVGNSCIFFIDGELIKNARLQLEKDVWYICQNEIDGLECGNLLGYRHSYRCSVDDVWRILDIKKAKKKIFNRGLEVGDVLRNKNDSGDMNYTVLGFVGNVVCLSCEGKGLVEWYVYDWLFDNGFYLFEKLKKNLDIK